MKARITCTLTDMFVSQRLIALFGRESSVRFIVVWTFVQFVEVPSSEAPCDNGVEDLGKCATKHR